MEPVIVSNIEYNILVILFCHRSTILKMRMATILKAIILNILNLILVREITCSTCRRQENMIDSFVHQPEESSYDIRTVLSNCEFGRSNPGLTLNQCKAHCQLRKRCAAIFYDSDASVCEMCSLNGGVEQATMERVNDNRLYLHRQRSIVKGMLCDNSTSPLPTAVLTSSSNSTGYYAQSSCLGNTAAYWSSEQQNPEIRQWIQVVFDSPKVILYWETRGSNGYYPCWVTQYSLHYGLTTSNLIEVATYGGNTNNDTIVRNNFSPAIEAAVLRLEVSSYYDRPCLRWEIYGIEMQ